MEYILTLELDEALSLIEYAMAQEEEELIFQRWINGPQLTTSYNEFKNQLRPQQVKVKSEEEVLDDVKDILALFER